MPRRLTTTDGYAFINAMAEMLENPSGLDDVCIRWRINPAGTENVNTLSLVQQKLNCDQTLQGKNSD